MCGRFTQERPASELAEIFGAEPLVDDPGAHYNIAPTDEALVVVQREERRAVTAYRWGLIPHWATEAKVGSRMFNARAETLTTARPSATRSSRKRCLVPVDSFYEWKREGTIRQPYRVVRRRRPAAGPGRPVGRAGATRRPRPCGGRSRSSRPRPNEALRDLHDRMPVIVPEDAWDRWLDPAPADPGELLGPARADRRRRPRCLRRRRAWSTTSAATDPSSSSRSSARTVRRRRIAPPGRRHPRGPLPRRRGMIAQSVGAGHVWQNRALPRQEPTLPVREPPSAEQRAIEVALLGRVRDGDASALSDLYGRFGGPLYSLAYQIVRDAGAAEDIVQEVFMAVWRDAGRFDPAKGSPAGWLFALTRHKAIDLLRRETTARSRSVDVDLTLEPAAEDVEHEAWIGIRRDRR